MQLRRKYIIYFFSSVIFLTAFWGCQKGAGDQDYGFGYIYMPQSIQSGASTNIVYTVPSGLDSATYNYMVDTPGNKLNIILGVLRSGKLSGDAFSVDVATNSDTINAAISDGSLVQNPDPTDDIVLLPAAAYSLPQQVSVAQGSNQATFYLSIDIDQLKSLSGKKAALAVYLDNPSKYELGSTNTQTIILIDVDALHLW